MSLISILVVIALGAVMALAMRNAFRLFRKPTPINLNGIVPLTAEKAQRVALAVMLGAPIIWVLGSIAIVRAFERAS